MGLILFDLEFTEVFERACWYPFSHICRASWGAELGMEVLLFSSN